MVKLRSICSIIIILMAFSTLAFAGGIPNTGPTEEVTATQGSIPNMAEEDATVNGRPVKMDTAESGEELTPLEIKIIRRDTIRSNIPAGAGNAGR